VKVKTFLPLFTPSSSPSKVAPQLECSSDSSKVHHNKILFWTWLETSSSQPRASLSLGHTTPCLETVFGCHSWRVLLGSHWQRPGMLLTSYSAQGALQSPTVQLPCEECWLKSSALRRFSFYPERYTLYSRSLYLYIFGSTRV
jgi:hypothetical protein